MYTKLQSIAEMQRISYIELGENYDAIAERVKKENIGFVITDENGNDDLVICPTEWLEIE